MITQRRTALLCGLGGLRGGPSIWRTLTRCLQEEQTGREMLKKENGNWTKNSLDSLVRFSTIICK
jgi:hypothetical protein